MSIYSSRMKVGHDPGVGRVAAYPQNRLSLVELDGWPYGSISTAQIPAWCVPDVNGNLPRDEYDGGRVSEWLRMSVVVGGLYVDVLIDRKAAILLAEDLRRWSSLPMVKAGEA